MTMTILALQKYYNEILILQQHFIFNVLGRHRKVPAILQDFNGIFSKYSLNITVHVGNFTIISIFFKFFDIT